MNSTVKIHKNFWVLILLIIAMLQWSCVSDSKQPTFENGTLDLTKVDFSEDPQIYLRGEGLLYWKQWPLDTEGSYDPDNLLVSDTINLAKMVSTQKYDEPRGYGTYRFFIKKKATDNLVLNISRSLAASEVWINGKKIVSHGQISTDAAAEKIDGRPLIVNFPNDPMLDVLLVFSNHKHRLGGGYSLRNIIQTEASYTQKSKAAFLIEGAITFLIIIFGLYQIIHFLSYRQRGTYLYLGLFCLFGGIRQLFVGEGLIYFFFPDISFDVVQKVRYIGYYGGLGAALLYHDRLFPGYFTKIIKIVGGIFPFIGCIYVLVTPTYYGTFSAPIFQVCGGFLIIVGFYQIINAVRHRKPFARGILISTSITLLFFANDLLNAMLIIQTEYIINYGLLLYVISQVILNNKIVKQTEKELMQLAADISDMASRIQRKEQEISSLSREINVKKEEITELMTESLQHLKTKEKLVDDLKKLASNDETISIQNIIADLKSDSIEDSRLTLIKSHLEELNYDFFKRIKEKHPNLTKVDLEICSYIRLSIDRNEIAKLRMISVYAVKKSRYRLRKKMQLSEGDDLDQYIKSI